MNTTALRLILEPLIIELPVFRKGTANYQLYGH